MKLNKGYMMLLSLTCLQNLLLCESTLHLTCTWLYSCQHLVIGYGNILCIIKWTCLSCTGEIKFLFHSQIDAVGCSPNCHSMIKLIKIFNSDTSFSFLTNLLHWRLHMEFKVVTRLPDLVKKLIIIYKF